MMKSSQLLRHPLLLQLIRFSVTGGSASLVHFVTVVFIVEFFKMHPLNANVIGFLAGFVVSFTGHRFWTFAGTTRHIKTSLPLFLLIAAINFTLNQSLFYLLLTKLQIAYPIALLIVLAVVACITFFLSKHWVFKVKKK